MPEYISLGNERVEYYVRTSSTAKRLRVAVHPGGNVMVTVPVRVPSVLIKKFLQFKAEWLLQSIQRLRLVAPLPAANKRESRKRFLESKTAARGLVLQKLSHFNQQYNFKVGEVTIRNQKTRWGSCSKTGNLNFNYKIVTLPERLVDLIIVHELCHLAEMNHSKRFWRRVAEQIPDYKERSKELKKWSLAN